MARVQKLYEHQAVSLKLPVRIKCRACQHPCFLRELLALQARGRLAAGSLQRCGRLAEGRPILLRSHSQRGKRGERRGKERESSPGILFRAPFAYPHAQIGSPVKVHWNLHPGPYLSRFLSGPVAGPQLYLICAFRLDSALAGSCTSSMPL